MQKPEGFLLDHSGVISYDQEAVHGAVNSILTEHGVQSVPIHTWLESTREHGWENFYQERGIPISGIELYALFRKHYGIVVHAGGGPTMYPDAADALQKIFDSGKRLGLISMHPEEHLTREITLYGVHQLFSPIIGSSGEKSSHITRVLEMWNMDPADVVYCGDMTSDIEAARRAGVRSVAVARGYHRPEWLREKNPDFLVMSLTELVEKLL